jgi:glycosyltransferase involved in cell wall biosynthesis
MQSIQTQGYADWRIIARDDCSSDETYQHLLQWQELLGGRMVLLKSEHPINLGMIDNYSLLLSYTTAPFVMLADPDDIWLPSKIETTLDAMCAIVDSSPGGTPIAICSDGRVVTEDLKKIDSSCWHWFGTNPDNLPEFSKTLVESAALSSTMMVNRALLQLALPLTGASCPDWWLALCAAAFGKIVSIPASTILYRRHSSNDSLAPLSSSISMLLSALSRARFRSKFLVGQYSSQAQEFSRRFFSDLTAKDRLILDSVARLTSATWLEKRKIIIANRLWFSHPLKNLGLLIFL